MTTKKTLRQRERELQALLTTPTGREELEALESQYRTAGGRARAANTSVVTFLLVYERNTGLIVA